MRLTWHGYSYYPYERELAAREAATLLGDALHEVDGGFEIAENADLEGVRRLTYFSGCVNSRRGIETFQSQLENAGRASTKRQSTRYSVHGLHEYKGKFNPQVARAILNIFGVQRNERVLDPFCGSGTTLVECAHQGVAGYGTDRNPMAVFLANAKLQALAVPAEMLGEALKALSTKINLTKKWRLPLGDDLREQYLKSWFDTTTLQEIEIIGTMINEVCGKQAPIFLAIASNLLRDYSLQDPKDLRIRRRKSPLPETPFREVFLAACHQFLDKIKAAQDVLGLEMVPGRAILADISKLTPTEVPGRFDAAITSPPYAMALPYIDTQRLSLVWLGLTSPENIMGLEAELIGSREIRTSSRRQIVERLEDNLAGLPEKEAEFCALLQRALKPSDGFRRKAVPPLLCRYFVAMSYSFRAISSVMKPEGRFALIVGHNHTVLGGVRYDIDTPSHLASIAENAGWKVDELLPLQTYQRYGYHMSNAVEAETLVLLTVR